MSHAPRGLLKKLVNRMTVIAAAHARARPKSDHSSLDFGFRSAKRRTRETKWNVSSRVEKNHAAAHATPRKTTIEKCRSVSPRRFGLSALFPFTKTHATPSVPMRIAAAPIHVTSVGVSRFARISLPRVVAKSHAIAAAPRNDANVMIAVSLFVKRSAQQANAHRIQMRLQRGASGTPVTVPGNGRLQQADRKSRRLNSS